MVRRNALSVLALMIATAMLNNAPARAAAGFSADRLRALGLSPTLGDYFADGNRFLPGNVPVQLSVNGIARGEHQLRFGANGQLCASAAMLDAAGLRVPAQAEKAQGCPDVADWYPGAQVNALPAEARVELVVPPEALRSGNAGVIASESGGSAALVNYDFYALRSRFADNRLESRYLNLESGFNAAGWAVRSHQNLLESDGRRQFTMTDLYARRDLPGPGMQLQIGDLNAAGGLVPAPAFRGLQLVPQQALQNEKRGVPIHGTALVAFSRVEVRQNGALLYSTLLPAGAFTLPNVPVNSLTSDLEVRVIGDGAPVQHFTVPAAELQRQAPATQTGLTLGLGQVRYSSQNDRGATPPVLTLSGGHQLSADKGVSAGTVLTPPYQNLAASLSLATQASLLWNLQLSASRDLRHHKQGMQASARVQWTPPGRGLSLSASVSNYSSGYRDPGEALTEDVAHYRRQTYAAGLSWSHPEAGQFSASLAQSRLALSGNNRDSQSYNLTWGHALLGGSLSVNWAHQVASQSSARDNSGSARQRTDTDSVFINWTRSFGGHAVNSYYRQAAASAATGLSVSGAAGRNGSYSLAAEQQQGNAQPGLSVGLNRNLHYIQAGMAAGRNGSHSDNFSLSLSGGLVAHRHGVTATPYHTGDTFGLAQLIPPRSGVELQTLQGPAYTDPWGYAVIPTIAPWQSGSVQLNTDSLPPQLDVANGYYSVLPAYAAVPEMRFRLLSGRRVMLHLSEATRGSAVTTPTGEYVTTAVDNGMVFISDITTTPELVVHPDGKNRACRMRYRLPEKVPQGVMFETLQASCEWLAATEG